MKRLGTLLILLLALLLPVVTLMGASDSESVTVSWRILPFQVLSIESNSSRAKSVTSTYHVPNPSDSDLDRGYIEERDAVTLVAMSNVDWRVNVRTPNRDMGTSHDGSYVKPIDDFKLRADSGDYFEVSNFDQELSVGENGKHEIDVDYRVDLDNDYKQGNYSITLIYTISKK